MEYYSAIKKREIPPFVTTWMDIEGIILSEVSQIEKDKYLFSISGVHSLLGIRPHSRRWVAGKGVKLHLLLLIARITAWTIPATPPRLGPWKNCLPRNRFLVPKKAGDCCCISLRCWILKMKTKTKQNSNSWKQHILVVARGGGLGGWMKWVKGSKGTNFQL